MSRRPLHRISSKVFQASSPRCFLFHTLWPTIWWNPSNLSDSRRDYASKRSPHVKFPSKENKPFSLLVLVEPFGGALSETPNLYYHRWGARIDTVHTPFRSISIRSHANSLMSSEQSPTQVLSWPNVASVFKWELMFPTWIASKYPFSSFKRACETSNYIMQKNKALATNMVNCCWLLVKPICLPKPVTHRVWEVALKFIATAYW